MLQECNLLPPLTQLVNILALHIWFMLIVVRRGERIPEIFMPSICCSSPAQRSDASPVSSLSGGHWSCPIEPLSLLRQCWGFSYSGHFNLKPTTQRRAEGHPLHHCLFCHANRYKLILQYQHSPHATKYNISLKGIVRSQISDFHVPNHLYGF